MNHEPSLNNNRNNVNNNVNNNNIDYDLYRWFHSGTNNSNNSINNPAHVPNMSRLSLSNYNNIHTNPLEVDEFPLMFLRNQNTNNNNINNNTNVNNNNNNTRNDNMNATTNLMMMLNNNSTNNANNTNNNNNNSNNSYNIGVNNSNNNSNGSSSRIYPFLLNNNNTTNNNNQHSTNNNNNNASNNSNNNNSAMSSGTSFTYNAIQSICANVSAAPPFLEDVIVCVNHSDVHWDSSRKNDVTKCCKNLGAKIMKTKNVISSDAILTGQTIVLFITMFKSGEEYEKMLHYGNKNVCIMSPYFLNFLISFYSQPRVQMTSMNRPSRHHSQSHNHFGLLQMPRFDNCHPLFAPLPSRDGIPHMKDFVISVTGFIGSERSDLKFLIRAVGAKYSGALSKKENTHLICCNAEGEKWRKAKEWKIKVVNFRWLWDCVEQWSYIDESAYQDVLVVR